MFVKISSSRLFSVLLVIVLMLAGAPLKAAHAAGECFVKGNASGTNTGTSWTNAYTDLQSALGTSPCTEIWVAAGIYKPTTGTDRSATFQLKTGVALYGGFAGTETARDQRDPMTNVTILSGDLSGDDVGFTNNSENAYHVVTGATGTTLDGFTITAGNATGGNPNDRGGGMYNASSSPTVSNLTFSGNSAVFGGGIYNASSSPAFANTIFSGNSAIFGGGLYNDNSSLTLTNVTFNGNSASDWGGGVGNYYSSPTLVNVTFSGNSAQRGGGMYNSISSSPQVRNTILWANTAVTAGAQIYNDSGTSILSDSVVQDGCPAGSTCTNIIIADPMLGALGYYGGSTLTISLMPISSAIDRGNDGTCASTDQRGITRPRGAHCDIGAYEYDYTGIYYVKPVASGSGTCQNWVNACTLQNALITAFSGDEIWVSAGTYKPTTGADRSATFQLKNGVALYGGFGGTETARTQRNPESNLTTLSGDIDNNDSETPIITDLASISGNITNSYHVVTGATGATLDGFTITAGNANGGNPNDRGGGMYNYSSSPALINIIFTGNFASYNGGGMYNYINSPMLLNVTFSSNTTSNWGGGMDNYYSSPTLTNVTFSGNGAINGGGIHNQGGSPTLTNVTFSGNSAQRGGGMGNSGNSSPQIRNAILWDNTASTSGAQIYNDSSIPVLSYSVVQDGCPAGSTCTNIVTADPMLGTLGNYGGSTQTIPLLPGSSAIDTGNDVICAADPVNNQSQNGITRPQDGNGDTDAVCDIGSYESPNPLFPGIASIVRASPSPTNATSVDFTIRFSVAVTGVDPSDFILTKTGTIIGESVSGVTGGPIIYTVSVNTGTGNGNLRLDVPVSATISTVGGNPLTGLPYTGGETYTIPKVFTIFLTLILR